MRFRRGLVIGKLAPLHRGHELVVRRALAACEEVVLLSWSNPELPGCEPERRRAWIAALFPPATHPRLRALVVTDELLAERGRGELAGATLPRDDAGDEAQRRFTFLLLRDLLGVEVDAVFTSEAYGDGLAATLTAWARQQRPDAPAVAHVAVDPERRLVPVSGSALRADVHGHREWLSPAVYASFVRRVALLGGESSGKSTLAAALAERLGTLHVAEYGRERWEERGGALRYADLEAIAVEHVAREEEAAGRAHRVLVSDTSPLVTLFYSLELFGRASRRLRALAGRRYDLLALCAPDFPFVQDGTRRDAAFRERQHAWYVAELGRRCLPWVDVGGPLPQRVERLAELLR